ncbi:adenylate/guanylate cyclase domain-containing protein [Algiphilus sp.]|uniref:adenylate/guanylate cyclase domain-containing protein n=1 Tax=Algiphilus sp. TaxID=1872431 RepID=UPI003B521F46
MTTKSTHVAVLFVDIVGSTKLYRDLGNSRAEALVSAALQRALATAHRFGGEHVKSIGDAIMCVFQDVAAVARACMEMQSDALRPPLEGDSTRLALKAGFAAGEVVRRDGDYFGDAVNIAARLADMAKAGQILTTEQTSAALPADLRRLVRMFDHTPVKGVSEAIAVTQLVWDQRSHTEMFSPGHVVGALRLRLQYADQECKLSPADLPFLIGRHEECHLVVSAAFASRQHVRLEYRRGKFVLVDESTNGTYVAHGEGEVEMAYLRNEPFALLGRGRFWLGSLPADQDSEPVRFEVD